MKIPLVLGALVILIIGVSPINAIPIFIAVLVAFSITRSLPRLEIRLKIENEE